MGLAYILVGILSAAVAVFSLQNTQPMPLRFVVWSLDGVPLAGAILAALAAGLILAAVPLSIELWRARARMRSLEAKVDMLESALTTRDTALLTPRPVPTPVPSTRSA
jgi:uncharacterized integral membrane protein